MTNGEEIIAVLKPRKDQIRIYGNWVEIEIQKLDINFSCGLDWWNAEYKEPTTKNDLGVGCIDRKKLIDWINIWDITPIIKNPLIRHIQGMSSVTPQEPKTGHWIDRDVYDADRWKCSECGRTEQYQEYFCPNCGAKMVESQKSEG